MKFPTALNAALKAGVPIRRSGWRTKFHLQLSREDATHTFLVRQHEDKDMRIPWGTITEDDMASDDWEVIVADLAALDASLLEEAKILELGTAPWAMAQLLEGNPITMGSTPLWVERADLERVGLAFILHLPNGAQKLFRFSPSDLHGVWTPRAAAA